MIPRPDPVPLCEASRCAALADGEAGEPFCTAHGARAQGWHPYAPAEPAPARCPLWTRCSRGPGHKGPCVEGPFVGEEFDAAERAAYQAGREQGQRDERARIVALVESHIERWYDAGAITALGQIRGALTREGK